MKKIMTAMMATSFAISLTGFALADHHGQHHNKKHAAEYQQQSKTIADVAVSSPDFKTLVTALQAAGLVETLQGEGPFTVFAPTDAAFKKIPEAQLKALLQDKDQLKKVLLYHVVPGKVLAKDVLGLDQAGTVAGEKVKIKTQNKVVYIDSAKVLKTDIVTDNGVIHVIDTVLIPDGK